MTPDRTVADWIAESLKTMALRCSCGHRATAKLADLPPAMSRTRLGSDETRDAPRAASEADMAAHYAEMEARGGFSAGYPGGKG